ncbi:MAG TPA: chemotaxis protein CheB [Burkholderiales bacterium]|nr:chemotaxis protein CheB [Burkholderiales bacterium]
MSASFDLVTIVASVGGLQAMEKILAGLPADFPLPIAFVQHRVTDKPEMLAKVLARHTTLKVKLAEEGETLRPGTLYVALPTLHLQVDPDRTLHHVDGVRVRHVLSSGDRLFESAAQALGRRVIGVVLSGYDKDGAAGARAIHGAGGFMIAQDAVTSPAPGMPLAAVETGCVDAVLPVEFIAPALVALAAGTYARNRTRAANDEASRSSSNGN